LYNWIVPTYHMLTATASAATANFSKGYAYLAGLLLVLIVFAASILIANRKKRTKNDMSTLTTK